MNHFIVIIAFICFGVRVLYDDKLHRWYYEARDENGTLYALSISNFPNKAQAEKAAKHFCAGIRPPLKDKP